MKNTWFKLRTNQDSELSKVVSACLELSEFQALEVRTLSDSWEVAVGTKDGLTGEELNTVLAINGVSTLV